jgi:hypothetical protein
MHTDNFDALTITISQIAKPNSLTLSFGEYIMSLRKISIALASVVVLAAGLPALAADIPTVQDSIVTSDLNLSRNSSTQIGNTTQPISRTSDAVIKVTDVLTVNVNDLRCASFPPSRIETRRGGTNEFGVSQRSSRR